MLDMLYIIILIFENVANPLLARMLECNKRDNLIYEFF